MVMVSISHQTRLSQAPSATSADGWLSLSGIWHRLCSRGYFRSAILRDRRGSR